MLLQGFGGEGQKITGKSTGWHGGKCLYLSKMEAWNSEIYTVLIKLCLLNSVGDF
jgi:hypothetical protein